MTVPLLITVQPKRCESLNSVIARACHRNVVEHTSDLLSLVGLITARPEYAAFTKIDFADAIADLLSIERLVIHALCHPLYRRDGVPDLIDWYGTPLPRHFIDAEARRYSPSSLRKSGHHRAEWMIKPLTYCLESREMLSSSCPRCGALLGWQKTLGVTVCETCGRSLKHHRAGRLEYDDWADATDVARLVSPSAAERRQVLRTLPEPFRNWEPGDVFAAAVELGLFFERPAAGGKSRLYLSRMGTFPGFTATDLIRGFRCVRDWPHSIRAAVAVLLPATNAGGTAPQFVKNLKKPPPGARPLIGMLHPLIVDALLAEGIPLTGGHGRVLKALMPKNGLVTATGAMQPGVICRSTLARLRRGGTSLHAARDTERGIMLFDADRLKQSIRIREEACSRDDVCRITGALPYALDGLVTRGLLKEVDDHDARLLAGGRTLYDATSAQQLAERLSDVPIRGTTLSRPVRVFRRQFHPEGAAAAIVALLAGDLRIVERDDDAKPILDRIWVDEAEATEFAASVRPDAEPEGAVPFGAAAYILSISEAAISQALRLELLRGKASSNLAEIPLNELLHFDLTFTSTPEIGGLLNVAPSTAAKQMRDLGFHPAATVYRRLLWNRRDAEALLTVASRRQDRHPAILVA